MILFNIEPKLNTMWTDIKYNLSVYSISMTLGLFVGLIFWRQKDKQPYKPLYPYLSNESILAVFFFP